MIGSLPHFTAVSIGYFRFFDLKANLFTIGGAKLASPIRRLGNGAFLLSFFYSACPIFKPLHPGFLVKNRRFILIAYADSVARASF